MAVRYTAKVLQFTIDCMKQLDLFRNEYALLKLLVDKVIDACVCDPNDLCLVSELCFYSTQQLLSSRMRDSITWSFSKIS